MPTFTSHSQTARQPKRYAGNLFNKPLAILGLLVALPVIGWNVTVALLKSESPFRTTFKVDALGRTTYLREFRFGAFKKLARLFDILQGNLGICGVPLTHSLAVAEQQNLLNMFNSPAGLISAYDVHKQVGLAEQSPYKLLQQQLEASYLSVLGLMLKGGFCYLFYHRKSGIRCPSIVTLFGIGINNTTMRSAVNWIVSGKKFKGIETKPSKPGIPRTGFFVNANSINVCAKKPALKQLLKKADCLFPDGSGLRIAARSQQLQLRDNVNGTDMLPVLCEQASKQNKSIFLLGAKPNIARQAALNLIKKHKDLNIAGYHHGYFSQAENQQVIDMINRSGADIVLVATGTPIQEQWICDHRAQLQCEAILGVGGLFDYFSGSIARAPLWMRELGLEWIWRLIQEPVTKFKRYVIGTPEFLYRTFVLNQVNKGV